MPDVYARLKLIAWYETQILEAEQSAQRMKYMQLVLESSLTHAMEFQMCFDQPEELAEVAVLAEEHRREAQSLFARKETLQRTAIALKAALTLWFAKLYGYDPHEQYDLDVDNRVLRKIPHATPKQEEKKEG